MQYLFMLHLSLFPFSSQSLNCYNMCLKLFPEILHGFKIARLGTLQEQQNYCHLEQSNSQRWIFLASEHHLAKQDHQGNQYQDPLASCFQNNPPSLQDKKKVVYIKNRSKVNMIDEC
jgi:hypothetical protein